LLVKLPITGAILLSGDGVHFKSIWENRSGPLVNIDKEKTLASIQHVAAILEKEKAHTKKRTAIARKIRCMGLLVN
jgi:hypothetical protein